jgi:hypothetical protein
LRLFRKAGNERCTYKIDLCRAKRLFILLHSRYEIRPNSGIHISSGQDEVSNENDENVEIVQFGSMKTGSTPIKRKHRERIYSEPSSYVENAIAKRNEDCCGQYVRLVDPTGQKRYYGRGNCDLCGRHTWDYCVGCYRYFCNSSSKGKTFKVIQNLPGGKQSVGTFRSTCFLIKHKKKMNEFGIKAQGLTSSNTFISLLDSEDEGDNNSMSDGDEIVSTITPRRNILITPNISENEVLVNSAEHDVASTSTSNSVSQVNASGANIDVSNTNEDESSEPEDSYTPFTPMTEMIVTPNNSDASASSSQAASKENVSTVATLTSNANSKRKTFLPTRKSKRGRIPKKFD